MIAVRWLILLLLSALASCGGGTDQEGIGSPATQRLRASSACAYEHIYVTVEGILVVGDAGEANTTLPSPRRIDLLAAGGILKSVGLPPLRPGTYDSVRLILADSSAAGDGANVAVTSDGTVVPLQTPSAQQRGVQLTANLTVSPGQTADLTLPTDPCTFVNAVRNSNAALLKPTLTADAVLYSLLSKGEFRVNSTTLPFYRPPADGNFPVMTALEGGGYVVVWGTWDEGQFLTGLYSQLYGADGSPLGGETQIAGAKAGQPAISALKDGGYVVAWTDLSYPQAGTVSQRYDSNGNAVGARVSHIASDATSYLQREPAVAGLADGGYVIAWTAYSPIGSDQVGIYARRYAADGRPVNGEFLVTTRTYDYQGYPAVAGLRTGGFVITFAKSSGYVCITDCAIYARTYASDGTALGSQTRVSTNMEVSPGYPTVSRLQGGGYVVVWTVWSAYQGTRGIYARRYADDGSPVGVETRVNAATQPVNAISVAGLADGGYVVTWASSDGSGSDVYLQRFDSAGAAVGSETRVNTTTAGWQLLPAVAGLTSGAYVVVWLSGTDADGYGFYGQQFDAQGVPR